MPDPTYHTLTRYHAGPYGLRVSVTANGLGTGWPGTDITFIVVGWKTREEVDIDNAHYMIVDSDGQPSCPEATIAPAATNQVNLSWCVQPGVEFDHFSVYAQSASSWNHGAPGRKLLPISTELVRGNIPGTARSATLRTYSGTIPQSVSQVPMRKGGINPFPANNQFIVRGNYAAALGEGSAVQIINAGANNGTYTLSDAAAVRFDEAGEYTLCTVSGTPFNTAITTGDALVQVGYWGGQEISIHIGHLITISRVQDQQARYRDVSDMAAGATLYSVACLGDASLSSVVLKLSKTSFDRDYMYARMMKWADRGIGLVLSVVGDSGLNSMFYRNFVGRLKSVDDLGDMNRADSWGFEFSIERVISGSSELRHFQITDVDATNDWIMVKNDIRHLIPEEAHIEIEGSTGNDGHYARSTSDTPTYDDTTNKTKIYLQPGISSSVADGKVMIYGVR